MVHTVYHDGMQALKKYISYLLDCIMPPYEGVRELESMDVATFIANIRADKASKTTKPLPIEGLAVAFPYRARLVKAGIVETKTHMNKVIVKLLTEAFYIKMSDELAKFASNPSNTQSKGRPLLVPIPIDVKASARPRMESMRTHLRGISASRR